MKLLSAIVGMAAALLLCGATAVQAQVPVAGMVLDTAQREPVPGATVVLVRQDDSLRVGAISDTSGRFRIQNVLPGTYTLRVSAPSYRTFTRSLSVAREPLRVPVFLAQLSLNEVVVEGTAPIAQQKGDTTEFNAQQFKVNRDASAEDLVAKMPGVTVQNGQVQSQGENVRRVLVDGRPMFDNDPAAALRNLPAEAVDRVQVYDDVSDQARFSGFNDGQTQRTLNIITRPDRRKAEFGRFAAGYGTDDRYQVNGTLNRFRGDNRLTLLAQSNNVNQQNFSFEDLFAGQGGAGAGGQRRVFNVVGGGFGGGGRAGGRPQFFGGGGSNIGDLLVNQSDGISKTDALGLNFSDTWGKTARFSGSYFFNQRINENEQLLNRIFANSETQNAALAQRYREPSFSGTLSTTHRWNGRLEWDIDSVNQLIVRMRGTYQDSKLNSDYVGETFLGEGLSNRVANDYRDDNNGLSLNAELQYRHRFAKAGRTVTLGGTVDVNDRDQTRLTFSEFASFLPVLETDTLYQRSFGPTTGLAWSGNLSYTEPLGKHSQGELSYNVSQRNNDAEQRTLDINPLSERFGELDTAQSNVFRSDSRTQQAGLGYRLANDKHNLTVRLLYSWSTLESDREFPSVAQFTERFTNLLPSLTYQYTIRRGQSLRVNYRTSANLPSINQLQDVVNVSNPQQPSAGNPNLRQELQHIVFARYSKALLEQGRFFSVNFFATLTQDYIANTTRLLAQSEQLNGVLLPTGAQFTRPENLNGFVNTRLFGIYALPLKKWKSNLNVNTNIGYTRTPGRLNDLENVSDNTNIGLGGSITSNISENVDFTLASNTSYNWVRNSLSASTDTYVNQRSNGRLDWRFGKTKGWLLQTDVQHQVYTGLSEGFNQNFALWNAGFGRKLFKNQQGEIKLYVFDILRQNNSLNRNVTETYFEDVRSSVLQRYAMLIFTYQIRKFHS